MSSQTDKPVELGSAHGNWFTQVGWRHLVAWIAIILALFPILFAFTGGVDGFMFAASPVMVAFVLCIAVRVSEICTGVSGGKGVLRPAIPTRQ